MADRGLFREIALGQVPRILGFGDRDEDSGTSGCFDRAYWHYLLKDFANARFQESALLLAILFSHDFPGNRFFGRAAVRRWARLALLFWARLQNSDGSFNEYYPFERSFCATAFSTYAASRALLLLDDEELTRSVLPAVARAGDYLAAHGNKDVANQMAAALAALGNCHLLTGDPRFAAAAEEKKRLLLGMQDAEGAFPEYGGCDTGYLSVTLSYLMKYHEASGDPSAIPPAEAAARYLEERVRPDGTFDWRSTSRGAQFLYPHGLVMLGSPVADRLLRGLQAGAALS
ncbi:MAG: hypothetical protein ACM3L8_00425, partial [Verrucomicrobiota bacterium]